MCGRAAQTQGAVFAASSSLQINSSFQGSSVVDNIGPRVPPTETNKTASHDGSSSKSSDATTSSPAEDSILPETDGTSTIYPWRDNFNLSPGHDAVVFTMNQQGQLEMDRKVWGLVTRGGTTKSSLPPGPSKHFANLMFNARSDTLFSKPSFSRLLGEGKTCLVALDGFFEWKPDALGGGKGKKQPYYVSRNQNKEENEKTTPYLLMAGLWTSVATGYSPPQPATLNTFTILTTEVCDPLKWLHSRMPVCVWDEDLAIQWLQKPSQKLLERLDQASIKTQEALLQWHAVTTQMNSTKFRSSDAIKPMKQPRSVLSFFSPKKDSQQQSKGEPLKSTRKKDSTIKDVTTKDGNTAHAGSKRPASSTVKESPSATSNSKRLKSTNPTQAPKKGSIASFFSPKKTKS